MASVRGRTWLLVAPLAVVAAWLAVPAAWRLVVRPESSRALRGREVAAAAGCFACHGAEGRGGVGNPGSRRETIPGFSGSTLMMYVHGDAEIRQYVADGRPDRLADDVDHRAEMEAQAIRMPAYRGVLSQDDIDLVVAYVRTVSGMVTPKDESAQRGLEVAQASGCFGCHGALGMGGRANPGSLKGYVPGFSGADFRELVRDDGELREWIRKGKLARVESHWIGGWFSRRQQIQMPAYERFLDDRKIDDLVALLRWIQAGGPEREPLS
ncbi:MAG TPA: c-type cytochrome [Candidatus Binatia bacterium]|nr:c-type cytochrome [Candidatus Binatia bacterium]